MKPFFLLGALVLGVSAAQATTFTVSNTNDAGAGSLHQAILDANAAPGADVVDATGASGTLVLLSAMPGISQETEIRGPGAFNFVIDGRSSAFQDNYPGVFYANNAKLSLRGFTLKNSSGVLGTGSVVIKGCFFTRNLKAVSVRGDITLQNCAFGDNGVPSNINADSGAAVHHQDGTLHVTNCSFSGNSAKSGGAVYSEGTGAVFDNCTFSNNSTTILNAGSVNGQNLQFRNCLFDENPNGDAVSTQTITGRNNLFSGGSTTSIEGSNNVFPPFDGPGNGVGELANNGGLVPTMALLAGSPAINSGTNEVLTSFGTDGRGTGFARQFGAKVDRGAFELQAPVFALSGRCVIVMPAEDWKSTVNTPLADGVVFLRDSDGYYLSYAITDANGFYQIANVNPGQYLAEGYRRINGGYDNTPTYQAIPASQTFSVSNADVKLPRFVRASIFGVVQAPDANGTLGPRAGVTVTLRDANYNTLETRITGADGRYVFGNLGAATYHLGATKSGFSFPYATDVLPGTVAPFAPALKQNIVGTRNASQAAASEKNF